MFPIVDGWTHIFPKTKALCPASGNWLSHLAGKDRFSLRDHPTWLKKCPLWSSKLVNQPQTDMNSRWLFSGRPHFGTFYVKEQYVLLRFTTKMNHMRSYDLQNWGSMFENTTGHHGSPLLGLTKMICSFPLAPSDMLRPPTPPNPFHQLESSSQICVVNEVMPKSQTGPIPLWLRWKLILQNSDLVDIEKTCYLRSCGLQFWAMVPGGGGGWKPQPQCQMKFKPSIQKMPARMFIIVNACQPFVDYLDS